MRKDWKLWILIAIALAPILVFVVLFSFGAQSIYNQKNYYKNLGSSFDYAVTNDCLHAYHNGIGTKISSRNAEFLLLEIKNGDYFIFNGDIEDLDGIKLDFGNGDIMWILEIDKSVVILYKDNEGNEVIHSTTETCRFITFERLISVKWGNTLLEE